MADVVATTIEIKRNDRAPSARIVVKVKGAVLDLTGYTAFRFIMRYENEAVPAIDASATLEDAVGGTVRYDWAVGDTARSGKAFAEVSCLTPSGVPITFPTSGYIPVVIHDDLDSKA